MVVSLLQQLSFEARTNVHDIDHLSRVTFTAVSMLHCNIVTAIVDRASRKALYTVHVVVSLIFKAAQKCFVNHKRRVQSVSRVT